MADAAQWAAHFGAPRIMHGADAGPGIEHALHGDGPWVVRPDGTPVPASGIDADGELVIIHVPGHTPGSTCLLHKPSSTLFSGDHLAADEEEPHDMTMFESFNWYSVPKQRDSIAKLAQRWQRCRSPCPGAAAEGEPHTHKLTTPPDSEWQWSTAAHALAQVLTPPRQ